MSLPRVLEPEVMDTLEEAAAYDAMDHTQVNQAFVQDLLHSYPDPKHVLDVGTGTALIPIELARSHPYCQIVGFDLSVNMLALATRNITEAGLKDRIQCQLGDAKKLPFQGGEFDLVMSNSIVHHMPDPVTFFTQIAELLQPGVRVFIRDLARPDRDTDVIQLVERYAADADSLQRTLFQASLKAALTVSEIEAITQQLGLAGKVKMTSDRHWTYQN